MYEPADPEAGIRPDVQLPSAGWTQATCWPNGPFQPVYSSWYSPDKHGGSAVYVYGRYWSSIGAYGYVDQPPGPYHYPCSHSHQGYVTGGAGKKQKHSSRPSGQGYYPSPSPSSVTYSPSYQYRSSYAYPAPPRHQAYGQCGTLRVNTGGTYNPSGPPSAGQAPGEVWVRRGQLKEHMRGGARVNNRGEDFSRTEIPIRDIKGKGTRRNSGHRFSNATPCTFPRPSDCSLSSGYSSSDSSLSCGYLDPSSSYDSSLSSGYLSRPSSLGSSLSSGHFSSSVSSGYFSSSGFYSGSSSGTSSENRSGYSSGDFSDHLFDDTSGHSSDLSSEYSPKRSRKNFSCKTALSGPPGPLTHSTPSSFSVTANHSESPVYSTSPDNASFEDKLPLPVFGSSWVADSYRPLESTSYDGSIRGNTDMIRSWIPMRGDTAHHDEGYESGNEGPGGGGGGAGDPPPQEDEGYSESREPRSSALSSSHLANGADRDDTNEIGRDMDNRYGKRRKQRPRDDINSSRSSSRNCKPSVISTRNLKATVESDDDSASPITTLGPRRDKGRPLYETQGQRSKTPLMNATPRVVADAHTNQNNLLPSGNLENTAPRPRKPYPSHTSRTHDSTPGSSSSTPNSAGRPRGRPQPERFESLSYSSSSSSSPPWTPTNRECLAHNPTSLGLRDRRAAGDRFSQDNTNGDHLQIPSPETYIGAQSSNRPDVPTHGRYGSTCDHLDARPHKDGHSNGSSRASYPPYPALHSQDEHRPPCGSSINFPASLPPRNDPRNHPPPNQLSHNLNNEDMVRPDHDHPSNSNRESPGGFGFGGGSGGGFGGGFAGCAPSKDDSNRHKTIKDLSREGEPQGKTRKRGRSRYVRWTRSTRGGSSASPLQTTKPSTAKASWTTKNKRRQREQTPHPAKKRPQAGKAASNNKASDGAKIVNDPHFGPPMTDEKDASNAATEKTALNGASQPTPLKQALSYCPTTPKTSAATETAPNGAANLTPSDKIALESPPVARMPSIFSVFPSFGNAAYEDSLFIPSLCGDVAGLSKRYLRHMYGECFR